VVNRRDVVLALGFAKRANTLAFVHHVTTQYELTVTDFEPLKPRLQVPVNPVEFNCDDLSVDATGGAIFIPSRQGRVRQFDAQTGDLRGEFVDGQALTRVALAPGGKHLALGTADGRVFVLDAASLNYIGGDRLHEGEVRGLAFLDDQTLVSAGLDKMLVKARLTSQITHPQNLPAQPTQGAGLLFLSHVEGKAAVATSRDIRQKANVITADAAKRLKLKPTADGKMIEVHTSAGPLMAPAYELGTLHLRRLSLGPQKAALCDACVPPGVELVLGEGVHRQARFVEDVARGQVQVFPGASPDLPPLAPAQPEPSSDAAPLPGQTHPAEAVPIPGAMALEKVAQMPLRGPATDLEAHPELGSLVVAYSHAPAVRTPAIYEAEKSGELPPPSPASGAMLVAADDLSVQRTFVGHSGFTVTASLSPDGKALATGGWDQQVLLFDVDTGAVVARKKQGWLVNRVRFSPDGKRLGVASWTRPEATGSGDSDPAMVLYPVQRH
jgi:hypothetical protein